MMATGERGRRVGMRRPLLLGNGVHSLDEQRDDLRDFMWVLRRALYLVLRWIEKRYGWRPAEPGKDA
jgi:hypothetical protein